MLLGDDVVDLEREKGYLGRNAAVLTAAVGSLPYQLFERCIHGVLRSRQSQRENDLTLIK